MIDYSAIDVKLINNNTIEVKFCKIATNKNIFIVIYHIVFSINNMLATR